MNTGIGDAANLAWKLAAVLRGRAAPAILASYESERLAFAKALVGTTDRAFEFMVGHGPLDHLVRTALVRIAPELLNIEPFRVKWFEIVSQILITYRGDPISEGAAGAVRGGDRLPWAEGPRGGNYARLTSLDWQIHVYGKADPALAAVATAHTIPVHELAFTTSVRRARLREDAMYLVRPDGHVGLAQAKQDPARLESYLTRHGISGAIALTSADATG
jgi:hypothetical protein